MPTNKTNKKATKTTKATKKKQLKKLLLKKAPVDKKKKKVVSSSEKKKKTLPKRESTAPKKKQVKGPQDESQKLRIRVMAYEHKILDSSIRQIMDIALRYDAEVRGPIPLPTEIKKYTVNRSSFVHKDAREQFEMRTHKRIVDIVNPKGQVIEALTNLTLPSGVSVDVKML